MGVTVVERKGTAEKLARARRLRAEPPTAEYALWQLLRRRQIGGFRFRRRAVVLGWIPDFWCPAAKVAIEIDAGMSAEKTRRDQARDPHLARHGIRTVHVSGADVVTKPSAVVEQIAAALAAAVQDPFA